MYIYITSLSRRDGSFLDTYLQMMKTMIQHPAKDYDIDDGVYCDKEVLVGEFGWPSAGRMREAALPSLAKALVNSNMSVIVAPVTLVASES